MHDSLLEQENVLSEQRDTHNFFERKACQAFRGECAAQTRLSEAQSELDSADRALCGFNLKGWYFIKRIN